MMVNADELLQEQQPHNDTAHLNQDTQIELQYTKEMFIHNIFLLVLIASS